MIELLPLLAAGPLRPPSVPLIAHDPYFSIWSAADKLTDDVTCHWTGAEHPLSSLIRIDGKTYRLMGKKPETVPALPQKSLAVWPTRTIYTFEGAGTEVKLTFLTPTLPDDIDVLSRPATYVIWGCPIDGWEDARNFCLLRSERQSRRKRARAKSGLGPREG